MGAVRYQPKKPTFCPSGDGLDEAAMGGGKRPPVLFCRGQGNAYRVPKMRVMITFKETVYLKIQTIVTKEVRLLNQTAPVSSFIKNRHGHGVTVANECTPAYKKPYAHSRLGFLKKTALNNYGLVPISHEYCRSISNI